ncbi:hypothetical protein GYMLUDRAFT_35279 [Collybiopsis luxurians FD-317 M1]|nr:hypothetical protein GYMLUDRAFT_35279 [Collybiopsis luxurians FD-317 M1]
MERTQTTNGRCDALDSASSAAFMAGLNRGQKRSALVIIDMQQAFFDANGPLNQDFIQGAEKDDLLANINEQVQANAGHHYLIIFIWADYLDKDLAGPVKGLLTSVSADWPRPANSRPSAREPQLVDPVLHIRKSYHSSFKNTLLDLTLREHSITHLTLAGVTTNTCVQATASDAIQHGYRVQIPSHLTAARSAKTRDSALVKITQTIQQSDLHPQYQLYVVNGSIPSWRCQLVLWELGNIRNHLPGVNTSYQKLAASHVDCLSFQTKRLRIMNGAPETRSAFFTEYLNHRGQAPVLVVWPRQQQEDSVPSNGVQSQPSRPLQLIAESQAICHYLTNPMLHPKDTLLQEAAQHALTAGWFQRDIDLARAYESNRIIPLIDDLEDAIFKNKPSVDVQEIRRILLQKEMPIWEMYLRCENENSPQFRYLGGQTTFTFADCFFYPILAFLVKRGFPISAKLAIRSSPRNNATKVTAEATSEDAEEDHQWPWLRKYYAKCVIERISCQRSMPIGWSAWRAGQSIF